MQAQDVATGKDTVKVDSSGEKPILIFDSMRMMDNLPFSPMQISTSTLNTWMTFNVDGFSSTFCCFQPPLLRP